MKCRYYCARVDWNLKFGAESLARKSLSVIGSLPQLSLRIDPKCVCFLLVNFALCIFGWPFMFSRRGFSGSFLFLCSGGGLRCALVGGCECCCLVGGFD